MTKPMTDPATTESDIAQDVQALGRLRDAIGQAIVLDGRIAVLYSNKDYGCEWDYDFRNKRFLAVDNTRFGVNVVTYAMLA